MRICDTRRDAIDTASWCMLAQIVCSRCGLGRGVVGVVVGVVLLALALQVSEVAIWMHAGRAAMRRRRWWNGSIHPRHGLLIVVVLRRWRWIGHGVADVSRAGGSRLVDGATAGGHGLELRLRLRHRHRHRQKNCMYARDSDDDGDGDGDKTRDSLASVDGKSEVQEAQRAGLGCVFGVVVVRL